MNGSVNALTGLAASLMPPNGVNSNGTTVNGRKRDLETSENGKEVLNKVQRGIR